MTVNPDALRFTYAPFEQPLRSTQRVLNGDYIEFVKRGAMKATWDSPDGSFYVTWAVEDDMTETYESEPALRQVTADRVADAYEQATR